MSHELSKGVFERFDGWTVGNDSAVYFPRIISRNASVVGVVKSTYGKLRRQSFIKRDWFASGIRCLVNYRSKVKYIIVHRLDYGTLEFINDVPAGTMRS